MFGLFDSLKIGAAALVGAALAFTYVLIFTVPAAREDGAAAERVIHEEQRRKAEAQRDAEREATQAQIDAIEADHLRRDVGRDAAMASLETALQQEKSRASSATCGPVISRELRDAISGVGRPAPRASPAVPRPPVP